MITKAKWVTCLATLLLAVASTGVAVGNGDYRVTVSVGRAPTGGWRQHDHATYVITATGPTLRPPADANLAVYWSETTACAATAKAEAELRSRNRASSAFLAKYYLKYDSGTQHLYLSRAGTTHICAYVYHVDTHMLAKGHASFLVAPPRPTSPPPKKH